VWDDAECDDGWAPAPALKQALVLTVGFLVKESKEHICLAHSITTGEHNTNGRIQIPKKMIKKQRILT
jgi:hypothetical protein